MQPISTKFNLHSKAGRAYAPLLSLLLLAPALAAAGQQSARPNWQSAQSSFGGGAVSIQQMAQPAGTGLLSTSTQLRVVGPYRQSVVLADEAAGKRTLTIERALELALRANLGPITAQAQAAQAAGGAMAARSALLPQVNGVLSENIEKVSLTSEGFSASTLGSIGANFPAAIGPFHFYTAQVNVQQSGFDLVAWRNFASAKASAKATKAAALDAREQLALAVAGSYLNVMAAESLVASQAAQVKSAQSVCDQAEARFRAGSAAEIEANRARVQLETEQQRLLADEEQLVKLKMTLARIIGWKADAEFEISEQLPSSAVELETLDQAYAGIDARQDLAALRLQLEAATQAVKATTAEYLPTAAVSSGYGLQGTNPNGGVAVYNMTASLSIPIFNGRRTKADITQAQATLKLRQQELEAATEQARADIRTAWLDSDLAQHQVALAQANQKLAEKNLTQSSDRFSAGATDSVEVVQAEQSLAAANNDLISAQYSAKLARLNLARSMGLAEKQLPQILKGSN